MVVLMIVIVLIIATSWWFILFIMRRNSGEKPGHEPAWSSLVDNLKSASLQDKKQLEKYLASIDDQIRNFETDYAFLVAFNTTVREVRDRIGSGESLVEN